QLKNRLARLELDQSQAISLEFKEQAVKKFVEGLPFKLTTAQRKAAWEILKDLQKGHPMNRLLEGDVGSGKTVVTAIALYNTAKNGAQSALLAPTEILARQHYQTLTRLLSGTGVKISLVMRSEKTGNYESGELNHDADFLVQNSDIVVGTHALIQDKVKFKNLALAVVDEQHRFGVEQRRKLQKKSGDLVTLPHFLSLSATPIPRSLALTLYGDLDLSILDEMPPGRKKIITKVVAPAERANTYEFIRAEIKAGRQVFVICPLIDPSDQLGIRSVKEEHAKLDKEIFPELSVGLLHGRLKAADKEKIMADFLSGEIKILVATSVIEVGVDAPNATVMMIEGAERFGLAQLHQFRGRVGRAEHQSHCFLFTENESAETLERLSALVAYSDGFRLAERDLQFRGPGEVFGTAQSGLPDLHFANLFDFALVKAAREWAGRIIQIDPKLAKYPLLKAKIGQVEKAHLE
ncbi:MAG: ATP-dependent DNA helicase RecG, partial [Patescibacteria group bacterium]